MWFMDNELTFSENKFLYCICPSCKTIRKKVSGKFNLVRRGYERNGFARFYCLNCGSWFNERTGEVMKWQDRIYE